MSVRSSAMLVLATATALAAAASAVYGGHAAAATGALLAAVGGGTLALAHAVAVRRARLGSLRRQFAFAVGIVVGQVLVATGAGALLMFVSPHDAFFMLLIAALASVVGARAAQLFAGGVMADIDGLRATLAAVGEGAREPSATTSPDDELADLAAAATEAIVKLAASEKARDDLVAAVSHDLRTPITSLRLLADAVSDNIVNAETQRRYLQQMSTHIAGLTALIDDLFELSRLKAGDIGWTMQRVRLDELLGETVDAMRAQPAAGAGARARGRARRHRPGVCPPGEAPARAVQPDPERDPPHTRRWIGDRLGRGSARPPRDRGRRHGHGIAAAERDRVFDPFFRGGTDTPRTAGGAGLGLAISRAIVEAHGGRIWLADSPSGTRVRLSLPPAGDRAAPRPS